VPLLELHQHGLYCPTGNFYIDPWAPVDRAVITHAHADRACPGSRHYLTAESGVALLGEWLGPEVSVQPLPYGQPLTIGDCRVSLHPAGHILGSAQVRLEHRGEVWVVSGDYKLAPDPTCAPFEPLACDTFVTESTFGLPIFRWPEETEVLASIQSWWRANREAGRTSVLFANPLGMAQRLLASLDGLIGPIQAHEEVERFSRYYRAQGILLGTGADGSQIPETEKLLRKRLIGESACPTTAHQGGTDASVCQPGDPSHSSTASDAKPGPEGTSSGSGTLNPGTIPLGSTSAEADGSRAQAPLPEKLGMFGWRAKAPAPHDLQVPRPQGGTDASVCQPADAASDPGAALVLAPPAAQGTSWMRQFAPASTAMVSGWMRIRGPRRRRSLDRGFVLSNHADWPGLLAAIASTRAETIWVTHGLRAPLVRWLAEQGRTAVAVEAHFAEDET
jgi:DNA ligase-associated putative exonuclease